MASQLKTEIIRALALAQGNRALAQKELLARVLAEDTLLRELTAPVLKPLILQALERHERENISAPATPAATPTRTAASPARRPKADTALGSGYNPMQAGQNVVQAPARPPASTRHVSTLKLLAAAYQAKRGEGVQ